MRSALSKFCQCSGKSKFFKPEREKSCFLIYLKIEKRGKKRRHFKKLLRSLFTLNICIWLQLFHFLSLRFYLTMNR